MYTQITDQNSSLLQFHLAFTSAGLAHTHYTDIEVCVLRNKGDLPGSCHLYGQHLLAFLQLDWELFPNITLCTDERKRFRGCWLARERTCVCECACVFFFESTNILSNLEKACNPSFCAVSVLLLTFFYFTGMKKGSSWWWDAVSLNYVSYYICLCLCVHECGYIDLA